MSEQCPPRVGAATSVHPGGLAASVYFVCAEEDIDRRAAMLKKKQRLSRIPGARICLCVQRLTQRSVCTTATNWGTARFSMYPAAHRDAQSLRERRVLSANEVRCCACARKPRGPCRICTGTGLAGDLDRSGVDSTRDSSDMLTRKACFGSHTRRDCAGDGPVGARARVPAMQIV